MFDFLKSKLDFLNPFKAVPAFSEALKKARASKDKGFFEKIGIFFKTFSDEIKGVEKEEEKSKKDTENKIDESLKLGEKPREDDIKLYDQTVEKVKENFNNADVLKDKEIAKTAFAKIKEKSEGKAVDNLGLKEAKAVASVGFMTLGDIKQGCKDANELKAKLISIIRGSQGKDFPLEKLLSSSTFKIFKVGIWDAAKFLDAAFDIGKLEAWTLSGLKSENMSGDEDKIVKLLDQKVFKSTGENEVRIIARSLNAMLVSKKSPLEDLENFSKIVFNMDDKDFENLAKIMAS